MNGYGAQHLVTLQKLENAGLLRMQDSKSFATLRRALRLVQEGVDEFVRENVVQVYRKCSVRERESE